METLCKNLKLTIQREDFEDTGSTEVVRLTLRDELAMTQSEVCYVVNQSTAYSRKYHVKEAVVIALRMLVDEAVRQGQILISASRGESTPSKSRGSGHSSASRATMFGTDAELK